MEPGIYRQTSQTLATENAVRIKVLFEFTVRPDDGERVLACGRPGFV